MMAKPARQSAGAALPGPLLQALIRLAQPAGASPGTGTDTATDPDTDTGEGTGTGSFQAAVLREISETILPREITLCIGGRRAAVLTVAQRRLAGLSLNSAADEPAAAEDPAAAAQLFASHLLRLEAQADGQLVGQAITFRRRPCAAPQDAGSCSAETLAAALTAATGSTQLDRFRAQVAALEASQACERASIRASATLYCPSGGGQPQASGPEALLSQLDAVRQALMSKAARPASARMPAPKPECLLLPAGPQLQILAATDCGALLLMALPPEAARALAASWSHLYG
ncbi:hypothetical protein AB838_00910 [Rhodobacteraceae bacterium (ex Bugula neritina AB1)]|nr:hypothetical protein AB838_00910 [Rhodobacteraceae bacterium (ex Bugula neritina AB1)]